MEYPSDGRLARRVTWLLLAAVALVGLAQVAFLPPWEGFDETAHWSYLQELSDTGHPPRYGVDGLAGDVDAYPGPMPYGGAAPFERTGRPTFRSYREASKPAPAGGPSRYRPGALPNWQAQHPPLYYLAMVPFYRAAHGLGWVDHLFVLRLASFAMAFAGFALGIVATVRLAPPAAGVWTGPILAGWPFFFPQFFPEFARLGNDSLCLLLAAVAWALILRLLSGKGGYASALGLGGALGLGLLTKAFFLPIGLGIGVILLVRWRTSDRRSAALGQALTVAAVALALGGWWYAAKWVETGALTGSDEFIRLARTGGVPLQLAHQVSLAGLARGLAVILATFAWAGTWSLARLPEVLLAAPAALWALMAFDYARSLRNPALVDWAPAALSLPILAGLVYHVFACMAGVAAETPGWYLHILCAPLGLAMVKGWRRPLALGALTAATALYTVAAWAWQLSLFSGCAAKLGGDKHYQLAGAGCFVDTATLTKLAHPLIGAASLASGAGLAIAAAALCLEVYRRGHRRRDAGFVLQGARA